MHRRVVVCFCCIMLSMIIPKSENFRNLARNNSLFQSLDSITQCTHTHTHNMKKTFLVIENFDFIKWINLFIYILFEHSARGGVIWYEYGFHLAFWSSIPRHWSIFSSLKSSFYSLILSVFTQFASHSLSFSKLKQQNRPNLSVFFLSFGNGKRKDKSKNHI